MAKRLAAMTTEVRPSRAPARIVVAVNAPRHSRRTLEIALALAAGMGAEVEALFVEDVQLLSLADLPFTREVDRASGVARELDSARMARALRVEAEQLRRLLAQISASSSVNTEVRVVRGRYVMEAMLAASNADVAFLHSLSRTVSQGAAVAQPRRGPGPASQSSPASGTRHGKPVWTVFDGTSGAARAMGLGARLAELLASELVVLLPGQEPVAPAGLQREAQAQLDSPGVQVRFSTVDSSRPVHLRQALAREGGSLLVLAQSGPGREESDAWSRLEDLSTVLVLVA